MQINKLFSKLNLEILKVLNNQPLHLRDIAKHAKCSPAKVHAAVILFKEENIVNINKYKNKTMISLNKNNPLVDKILDLDNFKNNKERIDLFDNISPLDFRYYGRNEKIKAALSPYLSESAFIKYLAKVETALAKVLWKRDICSKKSYLEIEEASKKVTAEEVYNEEDRIKHNIRALANSLRDKVNDEAKPYVHFTTTSHDIICSADAARLKDCTNNVLVPKLIELEKTLIELSLREKSTIQIGRTHGQHAEPITFGFAIAQYVDRLGNSILRIKHAANDLRGKIAGAVGAYNASSLFINDPEKFEQEVLAELKIKPSPISTQVVEAEYMVEFINSIISCFGVLANLSDDMRHLQRSEIGEVGEYFDSKQVGSSTMPQKRNPINFENVKSMWKEFMPRMITTYSDQISEHQRDLTNSASSRFVTEILAGFYVSVIRLNKVMSNLVVDKSNLIKNFEKNKEMITAEPLYILLAAHGHPDAHEYVRELTLKSQQTKIPLRKLALNDLSLKKYINKFTKRQIEIIKNPELYIGISDKKTENICKFWMKKFV